jgi:chromosome segregation ATPase
MAEKTRTRKAKQEPEAEAGDDALERVEAKLEDLGAQLEELNEQLDELAEQGQRLQALGDRLEASAPQAETEEEGPEAEGEDDGREEAGDGGEGLRDRVPELPVQTSALVAAGLGLAGATLFLVARRLLPSEGSGPAGGGS